jgi:hypothetical protein
MSLLSCNEAVRNAAMKIIFIVIFQISAVIGLINANDGDASKKGFAVIMAIVFLAYSAHLHNLTEKGDDR